MSNTKAESVRKITKFPWYKKLNEKKKKLKCTIFDTTKL